MKFYTGTKNHTPQAILPSNSIPAKSKMAAAAIFGIETKNDVHFGKQFYLQISLLRNSNCMGHVT